MFFLVTFIFSINTTDTSVSWSINAEFAVIFHVLALIGLYYWREKRNNLYLYLTGLTIALGIQVHLLLALHVITVLTFYIIDKPERKNVKTFLLFLLLAFSPILIYSMLKYFHVFETSGNYYGEYINGVLTQIFHEDWFKNINGYITPFLPFFILCFVLTFRQKESLKLSTKNLLITTATPLLTTLLLAEQHWYLLFVPVFSSIFAL